MATVVSNIKNTEYGYPKRVHVKGASEMVLATCSHYIDVNGKRQVLTKEAESKILEIITKYASNALRTICLAYKDLWEGEGGHEHDEKAEGDPLYKIEKEGLTCICILGIKDIIWPEVPGAVEQCQKAQVWVRMVTGDNIITATAIAKECKIIDES